MRLDSAFRDSEVVFDAVYVREEGKVGMCVGRFVGLSGERGGEECGEGDGAEHLPAGWFASWL